MWRNARGSQLSKWKLGNNNNNNNNNNNYYYYYYYYNDDYTNNNSNNLFLSLTFTRRQSEGQLYSRPPSTVTLTLSQHGWNTRFAYSLTHFNIRIKFNENSSRGRRDKKRKGNQRFKFVTFSCDLEPQPACWVIGSAHRLTKANVWQKCLKILPGVKKIWSGHKIKGSISWPWIVALTLSRHYLVMGSAHYLMRQTIYQM